MALKNRMYNDELIHHSDRGFQYCSKIYTNTLRKNKIKISVTQNGSPYENAIAERINGILKDEFGLGVILKNLQQAQLLMKYAVEIYNLKRPHWSNQLLTPDQMHQQKERPIKTWSKLTKL